MATDVTIAVIDSTGSICSKAVASKIMHSVFSMQVTFPSHMLLSLWTKSDLIRVVIDSSLSF